MLYVYIWKRRKIVLLPRTKDRFLYTLLYHLLFLPINVHLTVMCIFFLCLQKDFSLLLLMFSVVMLTNCHGKEALSIVHHQEGKATQFQRDVFFASKVSVRHTGRKAFPCNLGTIRFFLTSLSYSVVFLFSFFPIKEKFSSTFYLQSWNSFVLPVFFSRSCGSSFSLSSLPILHI